MARIKTDDEMRSEYMPKIKTFTDERLTADNAKRIYNYLKPYQYDTGGWRLYEAAKGILKSDVYSEFPAEDNMGYFESFDGYGLLKWLEIAKFAEKKYEQLSGGYEKLTAHTLNENTPEYQEYQNKLWVAAVRSIVIRLANIQPYLLEGFWNRLSYMENIIEKGLPTKDDLIEKINNDLTELTRDMAARKEEPIENLLAEDSAKAAIRNALHNTPLTDYQIQALFIAGNVLDDVYKSYQESGAKGDIYAVVSDYVSNAEKEYLIDRVYDRMKTEYDAYVDEVKKMPPEKIIDEAYKLTIFYEFLCAFDGEPRFTAEQLKAIMTFDDPLWSMYHEWQSRDWTLQDDIRDVIRDTANETAKENANSEYELDPNPFGLVDEAEDGQEP